MDIPALLELAKSQNSLISIIVVGLRLLLVLALTVEVALSLTLWFVLPLFFSLAEAVRSLRDG